MQKDDLLYLQKGIPNMEYDILYPTGFFEFDLQNGHKYFNHNTGKYEYQMGIVDGSMVGIIGRTNSGKSTFSLQLAGNLVRPFPNAKVIHIDIEQGASCDLKNMQLLKMTKEEYISKYKRYNSNITIETLENLVEEEMKYKYDNADELRYKTGKYNFHGEEIEKFVPTVILIDSIPGLISQKVMDSDRTNMDSANIANTLNSFLKKGVQDFKCYNIIILCINHVRQRINMSFVPKQSDMPGLDQDEDMPGGTAFKYNLSYLLRLKDLSPKFTPDKEFGISGCYVNLIAAKTRHGILKNTSKLYFNGEVGFIDYLSNFEMLKDRGIITQSGAYYNLPGYDKKVTKKQVIDLYNNDPNFVNALNQCVVECIQNSIKTFEDQESALNNQQSNIENVLSLLC